MPCSKVNCGMCPSTSTASDKKEVKEETAVAAADSTEKEISTTEKTEKPEDPEKIEESKPEPIPTTSKQADETKEAVAAGKDSKSSSDDEVTIVKDEAEELRKAKVAAEKKRQFKFNIADGGFTEVF